MANREKLLEQYEDALFALLMDEVAHSEGKKALALHEQLNSDPKAAVPLNIQVRCQKTIQAAFSNHSLTSIKQASIRIFRLLSAAALIILLLFTTAFATSETFRRYTLDAVLEIFDDYGRLNFGIHSDNSSNTPPLSSTEVCNYNITLPWLPDGYELTDGWDLKKSDFAEYYDTRGNSLSVQVTLIDSGANYQFDLEDASEKSLEIQGYPAKLIVKDYSGIKTNSLLWIDEAKQIVVQIWTTGLNETELLQLANGIRWSP